MKYKWGELISLEYGKPIKDKSKLVHTSCGWRELLLGDCHLIVDL
jgi:hypothetical protein